MQKTIDPLQILREHISQKKKIDKSGNSLIFDNKIKLKLDVPTGNTL